MPEASVALVGIVRNEIRAVVEWLAHYKALGCSEVMIYDNDSSDGTAEVLRALDEAGELIYPDWPSAIGLSPRRRAGGIGFASVLPCWMRGGCRNTDLAEGSGRMRAEALRLRDILLGQGLSFPVWPFVEA